MIKLRGKRVPFLPDVALYNRLMQVISQERIDRRISLRYLCAGERELIFDLLRQNYGVREIARRLGRSPGTISKELKRNRDEFGVYLPTRACQVVCVWGWVYRYLSKRSG